MIENLRYANIGIAVAAVVLGAGAIIFRDAGEGPLQAVALVGFFSAFAVFHGLEGWAQRRERKRSQ